MPVKGQINPAIRDTAGKIIPWRKRTEENRLRNNALVRAKRAKNPEKAKADNRRWRERTNPYSVAVQKAHLRAKELGVESTLTTEEWKKVVEERNFCCHLCEEKTVLDLKSPWRLSLDHILPMARGGKNTAENVLPAHRRCNQSRLDMTMVEFDEWLVLIYGKRYGTKK
jgi:hypothetical protein